MSTWLSGTSGVFGLMASAALLCFSPIQLPAAPKLKVSTDPELKPLIEIWTTALQSQSVVEIVFQSTGEPLEDILDGEIAFALISLDLRREGKLPEALLQFPVAYAEVVTILNLPKLKTGKIYLDPPTVGALFAARIQTWSDPMVQMQLPDLAAESLKVTPVFLPAADGRTRCFFKYLALHSPDFAVLPVGAVPEVGQSLNYTNEAIEFVRDHPGAVGYATLNAAQQAGLLYIRSVGSGEPAPSPLPEPSPETSLGLGSPPAYTPPEVSSHFPVFALVATSPDDSLRARLTLQFLSQVMHRQFEEYPRTGFKSLPAPDVLLIETEWSEHIRWRGFPIWP